MEKKGNNESAKNVSNKKKMNKKKKILIITLSVVVILIAAAAGVYMNLRNQIYSEYTPNETEGVNYKELEGVTNVLLIGTDGRTLDEAARSDTMIIATIDSNNKIVKTTSIMRDTLVNVPGHGEQKINAAFAMGSAEDGVEGGVKLLMQTIRDTFQIDLDKYVIVNFWGFESIIDEIGGIEANIKDYEIDELNKYIGEATGTKTAPITTTGQQNLNGAQALSYARIRKVGNGSYERTERQRIVLLKALEKLKSVNPIKYVSIANKLAKHVKTNIDIPEALNLAYTIYKFPELKFEQLQIPQNELIVRDGLYKDLGWVLLIDKKQNSKVLEDFIFNNKMPDPNEYDLNAIANLKAQYSRDENSYNSTHGINPEDYHNNKYDEEDVPRKKPQPVPEQSTKPKEPQIKPEEPQTKPEEPQVKPEEPQVKPQEPEVKPEEPQVKPEEPQTKPESPTR